MSTFTLISKIVLEGLELWSSERKHKFQKKYYYTLERLALAEDAQYPNYTDANVMLSKRELEIFLEAYYTEVKNEVSSRNTTTSNN